MPIDYSKWVKGRIVQRVDWTHDLFSLQIEAPEVKFTAGQFGRIALPIEDQMIGRPYSFVNSPVENTPHEFYIVRVDVGPLVVDLGDDQDHRSLGAPQCARDDARPSALRADGRPRAPRRVR